MAFRANNVRHRTTIEVANAASTTISRAGKKRSSDEAQEIQAKAVKTMTDIPGPTRQSTHLPPRLQAGTIRDVHQQARPSEYSQRRALSSTPTSTTHPLLSLSHPSYGLPPKLVQNLASLGVQSIYPWQSECLLRSGALRGDRNLIYTAPTGGGKSLVADLLMLKTVIECPRKKALLVLPYVALVQEKLRWLQKLVSGMCRREDPDFKPRLSKWRAVGEENAISVFGLFGGSKDRSTWDDIDIAVTTIEKANSLINAAIEDRSIGDLGIVVIDELHMLDDPSRGYLLELMATKLLSLGQDVQIIGMSATLKNAELLAKWLNDAKFYVSTYCPIPIEEHLVFDNSVYPASILGSLHKRSMQTNQTPQLDELEPCRLISSSRCRELRNPLINSVVSLASETARAGYGALIFCGSRAGCERVAFLVSQVLPGPDEIDQDTWDKRSDLLGELRNTDTGLDSTLEKTIPVGVGFHHAGLTTEERELLTNAYDQGTIKVIVATCSLAAGINLPARRVILHGARMGSDLVGPSLLRQMRGRAGRKGKDEIGETYLCCEESDLQAIIDLMGADLPSVKSCLSTERWGIKRALLEVIATKLTTSSESIDEYIHKTLLCQSMGTSELADMVTSALQELISNGLINQDNSELEATLLGEAIVASSLSPEDGLFIYRELRRALQAFVLDGEMHSLYSFTPMTAAQVIINWQTFRNEMERLDESEMRTMTFIGIHPATINRMAQGGSMEESTPEEREHALVYRRFYAALQLRDLCNEVPIHEVARKYELPRGTIQNLAQTCHGFAVGIINFCQRMKWGALASVLDHFSDRLKAGARADILALAKIVFIKSRTARVFWESGYKTVAAVAVADYKDLVPLLAMAQPKKLRLNDYDSNKYYQKLLVKAQAISDSATRIWEKDMQSGLDEEL